MNLFIENALPEDVGEIVALMHDFAAYENLSEYCTITEDKLHDVLFGPDAYVKCSVVRDTGKLIAYALYYKSFASFRGQRGYFLEDIFIDKDHRGRGVGEALLKQVAGTAAEDGGERIDFLVLGWNAPAIGFYERLGAVRGEEELHFKFSDASFDLLAGRS